MLDERVERNIYRHHRIFGVAKKTELQNRTRVAAMEEISKRIVSVINTRKTHREVYYNIWARD